MTATSANIIIGTFCAANSSTSSSLPLPGLPNEPTTTTTAKSFGTPNSPGKITTAPIVVSELEDEEEAEEADNANDDHQQQFADENNVFDDDFEELQHFQCILMPAARQSAARRLNSTMNNINQYNAAQTADGFADS